LTKSPSAELDYESIFKELGSKHIEYLVVGGLAVNMHGVPRMTYDIDLLIRLDQENVLKILSKLKEWGYLPRAPVVPEDLADEEKRNSWVRDKNMTAFSFYNENQPIGEIDLIIDSPVPYDDLIKRALYFDIGEVSVPVISASDLIELKRSSGRKQDISDVEHLRLLLEE
jgi:predicted nucleotidyltransferase